MFLGNYDAAGKALGIDLVQDPDQVAHSDKIGAATALWFWNEQKMNEPASEGRFGETTRIINSIECGEGNAHQQTRIQRYQAVRKCYGLEEERDNLSC